MRTVHSLLAIYGALDEMVLEAGAESETAAIIERYLPGTTGSNAGWFEQIRNFLSIPPGELPAFPPVDEAIQLLIREQRRALIDEERQVDEDPRSGDSEPTLPLTKSQLSRLAFVIGVLGRLPRRESLIADAQLAEALRLTAPEGGGIEAANDFLDYLQENFRERDDWPSIMMKASDEGWIDETVAIVPLCRTRLRRAHGQTCVVLDTEFSIPAPGPGVDPDDPPGAYPSLEDLENVIDPLNWDLCLPFFCDMQALTKPKRADGWSRVLEITSTTCGVSGTPRMRTPLKYWKGPKRDPNRPPGESLVAWVNYELDDTPVNPFPGDGLVTVDEGFIKMYSLALNAGAPGVRVVTRKVVCFRYLSEVAIAILACVSGYGNQGMDMLLDGVAKLERSKLNRSRFVPWEPSEVPASGGTATSQGEPSTPSPGTDTPSDGTRPSRRAIELAVEMATECIDEFSKKSTSVTSKMATGTMPIPEMIALNTELAVRLATDPWRYMERLREELRKGST
ncbi:MAG: hypothetical protein ACXVA6_15390 [Isosphaeraceae bacterium]